MVEEDECAFGFTADLVSLDPWLHNDIPESAFVGDPHLKHIGSHIELLELEGQLPLRKGQNQGRSFRTARTKGSKRSGIQFKSDGVPALWVGSQRDLRGSG